MAMVSAMVPGKPITSDHNGKELKLVKAEKTLDWNQHPVKITGAELKTLNAERVLAIMQGEDLTPSKLAGLTSKQIVSPTINLIDDLYASALLDYKQRLALASGEDLKQIRSLYDEYAWTPVKGGAGGGVAVGAVGAMAGAPFGPIGMIVGGAVGTLIGILSGFLVTKRITLTTIEREGSAQRRGWMSKVDLLEDVRFKTISQHICNASVPLIEDLTSKQQQQQTDKNKFLQLQQLLLVYDVIFPAKNLEVILDPSQPDQKTDVDQFVQGLTQQFPALTQ